MNPHFRKGTKSKNGAGHVWVLARETGEEGSGGVSDSLHGSLYDSLYLSLYDSLYYSLYDS